MSVSLLLFIVFGECGVHFCCYLLHFASAGVSFAAIYCTWRAGVVFLLLFTAVYEREILKTPFLLLFIAVSAFFELLQSSGMLRFHCKYCRDLRFPSPLKTKKS